MKRSSASEFWKLCTKPQRVCWAVAEHEGRASICPLGWHMPTSVQPLMLAVSIAPTRFTHELISKSGECVLAWPGEDLAMATYVAGTSSGRDKDKFRECGLTRLPARSIKAPLVAECLVNLECQVCGQLTTGDHTIFALEVVEVWVSDALQRPLCVVGPEAGYELLLARGHYRFGVVRR